MKKTTEIKGWLKITIDGINIKMQHDIKKLTLKTVLVKPTTNIKETIK